MIQLNPEQEQRAVSLHKQALVLNSLDSTYSILDEKYFKKMTSGGTNVSWVTVGGDNLRGSLKAASRMLAHIRSNSDTMMQVTTADGMEEAKKNGKVGVLFGTQNGACLEEEPELLEIFYKLGYRVMGLTYSGANYLGAGCAELTREVQGLSFLGFEVLERMNAMGILVDMAHSGDATTWDVLKTSNKPVVFTHCNARALSDTTRNKPNDQIKAMADTGGVMGVVALPRMVNNDMHKATLDQMLDHLDYIVRLVGVDHVGIGLDHTDANERFPVPPKSDPGMVWRRRRPDMLGTEAEFYTVPYAKDIEDMTKVPNITRGLVARGYSDEDIPKILGGNWLRVFKEVVG
ncbi:MAG: membrane dipeptidase [Pseudomonadota bacterium]